MAVVRRGRPATERYSICRPIQTPRGLPTLESIEHEMDAYVLILSGDVEPPWENGILTLHELSDAFYARAREIEGLIYRGERNGEIHRHTVKNPSPWYQFRTGELQSYLGLFRHAAELGSRRVTAALEFRDE